MIYFDKRRVFFAARHRFPAQIFDKQSQREPPGPPQYPTKRLYWPMEVHGRPHNNRSQKVRNGNRGVREHQRRYRIDAGLGDLRVRALKREKNSSNLLCGLTSENKRYRSSQKGPRIPAEGCNDPNPAGIVQLRLEKSNLGIKGDT